MNHAARPAAGSHDEAHERWLEERVAAGCEPQDPALRARLAECETCAERFAEVRAVAVVLDRSGAAMREDLRAARAERGAPGEERISAALLDGLDRGRRGPPVPVVSVRRVPRRAAVGALLALAAGVLAWAWVRDRGPTDATDRTGQTRTWLGGSLALEAPKGSGADLSEFRWTGDLPPSGWFVVIVRGSDGTELLRSPRLSERVFRPRQDVALPDAIEWSVESHDSAGLRETVTETASRA